MKWTPPCLKHALGILAPLLLAASSAHAQVASFAFTPAAPTVGQAVAFTDSSTGSPTACPST